jgi:hypothetical protein
MVAFGSAAAAVSCAVLIQQGFERRNRSASEPLSIKIGVSAGDASTTEGDVFGMPVIEAARLCDRCSAGQILAKELVAHLAVGRGHAFVPVGALELKGLPEPLGAVEVQWAPAPVTGLALPKRLRELPATAYVGRAAERKRLTELWGQAQEGSLRLALIAPGRPAWARRAWPRSWRCSCTARVQRCSTGALTRTSASPISRGCRRSRNGSRRHRGGILDAHVDRFGGDLVRLVPSLRDRVADLPSARESDPETERYLLYAAVAGQLAAPPGMVYGTFAWALGTLAATLERHEQAEGHFAAAAAIEESLGAPLFLARTHAGWARALIARGRPEDLERAQPMLEQVQEIAGRLGAGGITREGAECRAALAATSA